MEVAIDFAKLTLIPDFTDKTGDHAFAVVHFQLEFNEL
jgi:hypothetical protein